MLYQSQSFESRGVRGGVTCSPALKDHCKAEYTALDGDNRNRAQGNSSPSERRTC
jgi:hypothetical protein